RARLLREEETIAALREAQAYTKAQGEIASEYRDIYKEAQAVSLVWRVLCRAEARKTVSGDQKTGMKEGSEYYPQLFTSAQQLRASFTESEMAVCMNAYELVKAKYRFTEAFDPAEIDMWAERLSEALTGPLWLSRLDSALWPALLTSLAQRVCSLLEML